MQIPFSIPSIIMCSFSIAMLGSVFVNHLQVRQRKLLKTSQMLVLISMCIVLAVVQIACSLTIGNESLAVFLDTLYLVLILCINAIYSQFLQFVLSDAPQKVAKWTNIAYLIPAAGIVLALTNSSNHLFIQITDTGQIYHGIGAVLHIMLSCSIMVLSLFVRLVSKNKSPLDRHVLATLTLIVALPASAGIAESILALSSHEHYHLQVFLINISVLFTYYICYGYLHTSRRMAIQAMQEAYVVFDKFGNLADINQKAVSLFQPSPSAPRLTRSLFAQCLQVPDGPALDTLQEHEFRLFIDGISRWFSASVFRISDSINQHCADGFIVREITDYMEEMDKLNDMATVDALTQVRNRRYLNEYSPSLMRAARKSQRPITLLMFDLDKFKNINDTYGHPVGDKVLVLVCNLCKHALRKSDELFRIGGEEFVIICKDTTETSGELLAERIRSIIESTPLITEDGYIINITVSIGGVSFIAGDDDTLEQWLQLADERLYFAKQSGRNRVAFYHAIDNNDWFVG